MYGVIESRGQDVAKINKYKSETLPEFEKLAT